MKPSPVIIEIRIHAGSSAFNSVHGNIERAVTNVLESEGHSKPRIDMVHKLVEIDAINKVVIHQRLAGDQSLFAMGERSERIEAMIARQVRKIVGYQARVSFVRDADRLIVGKVRDTSPAYHRPPVGRARGMGRPQAIALR
ncbi:MAG: hypothetical protein ABIA83_00060 [Patescibacteria group bacterium]